MQKDEKFHKMCGRLHSRIYISDFSYKNKNSSFAEIFFLKLGIFEGFVFFIRDRTWKNV